MATLKKLKGIFWKDAQSQSDSDAKVPSVSLEPLKMPSESIETPAEVDSEFYGAIEKEIAKSVPIEFAEYYNQMSVINDKFSHLDEATRYQLAFHAAKTALKNRKKNLTPDSLGRSIDQLKKVLESERQQFETQNEQGYRSNLSGIQKKAQEMSRGVEEREKRIKALQQEIDAFLKAKNDEKRRLEDERAQLISQRVVAEGEINQLDQKKKEREIKFNTALEAHHQRLDALKAELEDHLKDIK
jgi:DNA repair exonuclease SbcCD ATPase subunit